VLRYGIMTSLALVASCATAGSGETVDASTPDAPRIDAQMEPPKNMCPSTATCVTAMMLGEVSGDTNSPKLTASGYQSAWYRVRVTEDYNDPLDGEALRLSAKLTSPTGVDFDVFVYRGPNANTAECAAPSGTVTTNGTVNEARLEWGEGADPNGVNDVALISIEIRPISGACASTKQWQLEVQGDWQ
jgi:hypothetical protein